MDNDCLERLWNLEIINSYYIFAPIKTKEPENSFFVKLLYFCK